MNVDALKALQPKYITTQVCHTALKIEEYALTTTAGLRDCWCEAHAWNPADDDKPTKVSMHISPEHSIYTLFWTRLWSSDRNMYMYVNLKFIETTAYLIYSMCRREHIHLLFTRWWASLQKTRLLMRLINSIALKCTALFRNVFASFYLLSCPSNAIATEYQPNHAWNLLTLSWMGCKTSIRKPTALCP